MLMNNGIMLMSKKVLLMSKGLVLMNKGPMFMSNAPLSSVMAGVPSDGKWPHPVMHMGVPGDKQFGQQVPKSAARGPPLHGHLARGPPRAPQPPNGTVLAGTPGCEQALPHRASR